MKEIILRKINEIQDPDIGIGIVDLGLIYEVQEENDRINIVMTLTTPACPLAGAFEKQVQEKLSDINKNIHITFTFDPPWSMDRISEETRLKLGIMI